jgi:hypothetical protein
MPTMPPMLAVHEDMKKWKDDDQQPWQPAKKVRAVFRNEVEGRYRE